MPSRWWANCNLQEPAPDTLQIAGFVVAHPVSREVRAHPHFGYTARGTPLWPCDQPDDGMRTATAILGLLLTSIWRPQSTTNLLCGFIASWDTRFFVLCPSTTPATRLTPFRWESGCSHSPERVLKSALLRAGFLLNYGRIRFQIFEAAAPGCRRYRRHLHRLRLD